MQIAEYRMYVKELVELGEIMSKRFYLVVPYSPATDQTNKGFIDRLTGLFAPTKVVRLKEQKFKKMKFELDQRIEHTLNGLQGMSVSAVQLDTQSLIELYYRTYNPDLVKQQKLENISELKIES